MRTLKILNRSVETRIDRIQIGRKLQQLGKKDKKQTTSRAHIVHRPIFKIRFQFCLANPLPFFPLPLIYRCYGRQFPLLCLLLLLLPLHHSCLYLHPSALSFSFYLSAASSSPRRWLMAQGSSVEYRSVWDGWGTRSSGQSRRSQTKD